MSKHDWARLNHLQVGKYAEYLVKMELVRCGLDIYTGEVDDRGIDFVVRCNESQYYDVQVKAVRGFSYIFFAKDKFELRDNLLAAVVLLFQGKPPEIYLIPAAAWKTPDALFVSRDYEVKKSKPEWGLNLSNVNMPSLKKYLLETVAQELFMEKE